MPGAAKTARDEKLWSQAKAAARKKFTEGSDRFYKYAMGIYKKTKGKAMPKKMITKSKISQPRQVSKPVQTTEGTTMEKSKYPLMQKAIDSTESSKVSVGLEEFPQMQKAVESGSMSKSVKFYKKGSEIKQSVLAKIERCKIEITALKAGIKATPEVDTSSGMAVATKDVEEAVEPWEIRNKRRDIERLQTVADNIDVSKKFELSEYELTDYGF